MGSELHFYIEREALLSEIFEKAMAQWPDLREAPLTLMTEQIRITAEYMHTDCRAKYDAFHYTNFLKISRKV